MERRLLVDDDAVHIGGDVIPEHPDGEVEFAVEELRAPSDPAPPEDDVPAADELFQIGQDLVISGLAGRRPQHEPHPAGHMRLHELPQPRPYGPAGDLPGQGDPAAERLQDDVPPGQGDVLRHTGTFVAPAVLDDLHKDLLSLGQMLVPAERQETVPVQVQIDEGRLDSGHHIADAAPVDIAHKVPAAVALDDIILQPARFHKAHARLFRTHARIDTLHGTRPSFRPGPPGGAAL